MTSNECENLRSRLVVELSSVLGVKEFRTGRETIRDENGRKIAQRWIDCVWAVVVQPAFSPWLGIGAVRGDNDETRVAMVFQSDESPVRRIGPIVLPSSQDLVFDALGSVQLIETVKGVTIDGTGYWWTVLSGAMSAILSFSNPRTPSLEQLESRLIEFVRMVATVAGEDTVDPVISGWLEHVEKLTKR